MLDPIGSAPISGTATTKTPLAGRTVTWTSSVPGVCAAPANGTTDANGQVQPVLAMLAAGTTNLQATCEGKTSNVVVVVAVAPASVSTVTVTPSSLSGLVGATGVLSAVVKDNIGNVLAGRVVTWATSNAAVVGWTGGTGATLTVNYLAAGTANVQAWCQGVGSNTVAVTVSASAAPAAAVTVSPTSLSGMVGGSATLTATVKDANGNILSGRTIAWASSSPGVASVTASGQSVTVGYLAAGAASITAQCEGISSASVGVAVSPLSGGGGALTPNLPAGYIVPAGYASNMTALPDGIYTVLVGTLSPSGAPRNASTYNPGGGVTAPSNPPSSAPGIQEILFPTGFTGGGFTPGSFFSTDFTSNGWLHLYSAMTVQFSSNWFGHSSGVNKVWLANGRAHVNGSAMHNRLCVFGFGTGSLTWQWRLNGLGVGANGLTQGDVNINTGWPCTRGLWQRLEVEAIYNTPGLMDGRLRLWMTDYNASGQVARGPTLVTDVAAGWAATGDPVGWFDTAWEPIWGGTGSQPVPATMYMWCDHFITAGK